jgi:coproporphyrinogen III oxidase
VFERAVIGAAALHGSMLPAAATERRLELAGRPYRALTLVAALHPRNPCVPAAHLHLRYLTTAGADPTGWFAGGFDLIPSVPFAEDARHWHRTARDALAPFGEELHPRFKEACDRATFLPHRGECLGVGGIAFEDLHEGGFDRCLSLAQAVGEGFIAAYSPIVSRRREHPFGERERSFQLERRGRTVEYLLLRDRMTLAGLRGGGRGDAALLALPPSAAWPSSGDPLPGSPEERLLREFLQPRDWLAEERLAGSAI